MFRKILAPLKDTPNVPTLQQSPQKARWRDARGKENLTASSPVHVSEPSDFRLIAHVECDPNTGHYKGIDEFMTIATLPRGKRSPIKSPMKLQSLPLPPTRSVASLQALHSASSSVSATISNPLVSCDEATSPCDAPRSVTDIHTLKDAHVNSGSNVGITASPSAARPPRPPAKVIRTSPVTPPSRRATAGRTNVSRPIRTKHVVHVRLDPQNPTGFAGLPLAWENILMLSGILHHEAMANPEAVIDVLNFSKTAHSSPQIDGISPSPRALPPIQLDNLPSITSFDDASDGPLHSSHPTASSSSCSSAQNSDFVDDQRDTPNTGGSAMITDVSPRSSTTPTKMHESCAPDELNSDFMENFIGAERKINLPDGIPDYVDANFRQDDPNTLFSRLELIGEGSCGNVFRAIDRDGKFVALKKVRPENERDWKLYKFEVHVMQDQTNSENLVVCYDAFRHDDELWMVMEYVSAGTLADLLSGRRAAMHAMRATDHHRGLDETLCGGMDESVIAFICREVLRGLDSLHSIRRVHRDIKGDNVLLDLDGSVKVADFGFCAELSKRLGKRNTVVGTPFWMAPEVIRGANYDTKIDIWSTGILALECAQGKPPHLGVSPIRAMFLIATQGAPDLPKNAKWSDELCDFIQKCCSVKPSCRPSARQALMHPFISKACSKEDAAAFFNEACEERIRIRRNT